MRQQVKRALLGLGHYARRLRKQRFPGVAVLCYHGIRPDGPPPPGMAFPGLHVTQGEFDAHCRLLRETCHPISLDDWRAAWGGGRPLPERPVLVTFDDGYRSVLTRALPVLVRHVVPAAVFVCTEPVEKGWLFWYDALARRSGEAAVERLKALGADAWQREVSVLARDAGPADPDSPLDLASLRDLAASGLIEIGSHTASHPILARVPRERQTSEVSGSRTRLQEWTGREVRGFAYPNGRPREDYDRGTVEIVKAAGHDCAFTTRPAWATPRDDRFELPRFLMLAGTGPQELAHRLSYSWHPSASAS
jgi:peptidoglycan/xylan/chitin deacetylase (PgdA/CDA1 family)